MKNTSIRSAVGSLIFRLQKWAFARLINSRNAWPLFDESGIEGFGTNLLRLYFPVYYDQKRDRDSFSGQTKSELTALLENCNAEQNYHELIADELQYICTLPVKKSDARLPFLDNYFFGIYDASVLVTLMRSFRPSKVVEIGSGVSTRYMRYAKDKYQLPTQIICIDPNPRASIQDAADEIINRAFEDVIHADAFHLTSGDMVFMDGSHYTFQGNDTLTFFFKLLPALPPGVIIHIHDIYLPHDYAGNVARQLWSEQYLLASLMLGGFKGYEVIYPAYYLSQTNSSIRQLLASASSRLNDTEFSTRPDHTEGYSFWFRKL